MSKAAVHSSTLRIPAGHPALPGHFPGRPIVPGVVLLQCVLDEAERWLGRELAPRSLPQAKFSAPLLPEQDARLELRLTQNELRFSVTRAAQLVAQGRFALTDTIGSGRAA